jgi:hypothetical protein
MIYEKSGSKNEFFIPIYYFVMDNLENKPETPAVETEISSTEPLALHDDNFTFGMVETIREEEPLITLKTKIIFGVIAGLLGFAPGIVLLIIGFVA